MTESARLSGSDAKRAARNVSVLMAASIVSKGALYLWQIALSVLLGPSEYGIYGTVGGMMVTAASVAGFGLGLIVIRDVAREPHKAGKYWTCMLFAQTVLALFAYIGMNAFAIGYSDTLRGFAALAGINLFIDLFGNMGYDLLVAQEKLVKTSLVEIVHIAARIALAWLALMAGWGLLGVYGAAILSGIFRSIALVGLNLSAGVRPQFPLDWKTAKPLLINSAPLALSAFLTLAYSHSDKLLTTGILSERVTGYLTAAFVINFGVIELLSVSVLVAAYPLLSRYYEDGRNPLFGFMVEKLALYMILVALPMALSVSILADKIMLPLLGEAYAPSAGILRLLIWYTGITIVGNVFNQGLLVQNRQRRLLLIRGSSLALNISLTALLLLNLRDPRGAVIASIVGEILVLVALLASFRAKGWQPERVALSAARAAVAALPAALVMLALRDQFIALPLLGGLGVYVGGVIVARVLSDEDWDLIYRLASATPGAALVARLWKRDVEASW
ncbi:MAG: oligosaccharide flippase family protein [Chloroflexi bacterium]|nr:oligosaccharide flippase family protein [Chloroflexota bacterium]